LRGENSSAKTKFPKVWLTRRGFLQFVVIGGVAGFLALYNLRRWFWSPGPLPKKYTNPKLDVHSPRGRLSEEELKNMIALGEVLIPPDETPGADEGWIRSYVNTKTENDPGYLREYQTATELLDQMAKELTMESKHFWELSTSSRDSLLIEHFSTNSLFRKILIRLHFIPLQGKSKLHLYNFVLRELIQDFYSSPAGWAVVGYTNYPGVPGNPREYTEAPKEP